MNIRLTGYRDLDFTDDNGKPVKGTQLFGNFLEEGVNGHAADKFFIKSSIEMPTLTSGTDYDIEFNRKGKVISVTLASQVAKININKS